MISPTTLPNLSNLLKLDKLPVPPWTIIDNVSSFKLVIHLTHPAGCCIIHVCIMSAPLYPGEGAGPRGGYNTSDQQ